MQIETERLTLAPFAPEHREALNAMHNNRDVMRFLSSGEPETMEKTDAGIARNQAGWQHLGYGWWVVILRQTNQIIGAACLQKLAHIETNPLEIGWRLLPEFQGHGYATEAGQAAADFAFNTVGVDFVKAVCNPANLASEAVMKRLGMTPLGTQIHYDEPCTTYRLDRPA